MTKFQELQDQELARARKLHPRSTASNHEGYAVIKEEVDELWDEVKKKNPDRAAMAVELIQIAAMCEKMAQDLGLVL